MTEEIRLRLHDRLQRAPCDYSVPYSLPVVAFGELDRARVATVGLNPSHREYLDRGGHELEGAQRRFETLRSLEAQDRASLSPEQCEKALKTMRRYFQPDRPVYAWFRSIERVLEGMGLSYQRGEAVHLDLAQEATKPAWSMLLATAPQTARELMRRDAPFLAWQIEAFPFRTLLCNGRSVHEGVLEALGGELVDTRRFGSRLRVLVGRAHTNRGSINVLGWNLPLARAGLTKDADRELGALLRSLSPLDGMP